MLKKLVAGALLTVSSLTGGMGLVSASTEKRLYDFLFRICNCR